MGTLIISVGTTLGGGNGTGGRALRLLVSRELRRFALFPVRGQPRNGGAAPRPAVAPEFSARVPQHRRTTERLIWRLKLYSRAQNDMVEAGEWEITQTWKCRRCESWN